MNKSKNAGTAVPENELTPTQRELQIKRKSLARLLRQKEAEKRRPRKPKGTEKK